MNFPYWKGYIAFVGGGGGGIPSVCEMNNYEPTVCGSVQRPGERAQLAEQA